MKGYIPAALTLALLFTGPALAEKQKLTPVTAEAVANLDGKALKGKVLETHSAAGYTYLLIEGDLGKNWAAIPASKVEVGQEVVVSPGMLMKSFESKALGKTFDVIVFSTGLENSGNAGEAPNMHGQPAKPVNNAELEKLSGGSERAVVPANAFKVKKADGENAQTVEDCFVNVEKLNGKTVRVRGKVVKFSSMIMGKNWIHLQDGTGTSEKKTHDLVVTTQGKAEKGSEIIVEGTLHKDKDFGAGYKYLAILEDAKIVE
ncbi:MAG: DNA-binding protein [Candidatus Electrothrix sp. AR4]|nr:DNA-binding protein [Candidatus Electrothrix sp. AR4]